ncbi:hypothetical protein GGX14DRAFT_607546 [Mycena pura]|uniref:Uncharacterized protein n=1 Tax=Mycena pura TaxID=153505 RepID=A0AAD6UQN1_9AGAR|nr:hypothetical protein GGX14DRAFT_607546 [Mycena pura]
MPHNHGRRSSDERGTHPVAAGRDAIAPQIHCKHHPRARPPCKQPPLLLRSRPSAPRPPILTILPIHPSLPFLPSMPSHTPLHRRPTNLETCQRSSKLERRTRTSLSRIALPPAQRRADELKARITKSNADGLIVSSKSIASVSTALIPSSNFSQLLLLPFIPILRRLVALWLYCDQVASHPSSPSKVIARTRLSSGPHCKLRPAMPECPYCKRNNFRGKSSLDSHLPKRKERRAAGLASAAQALQQQAMTHAQLAAQAAAAEEAAADFEMRIDEPPRPPSPVPLRASGLPNRRRKPTQKILDMLPQPPPPVVIQTPEHEPQPDSAPDPAPERVRRWVKSKPNVHGVYKVYPNRPSHDPDKSIRLEDLCQAPELVAAAANILIFASNIWAVAHGMLRATYGRWSHSHNYQ